MFSILRLSFVCVLGMSMLFLSLHCPVYIVVVNSRSDTTCSTSLVFLGNLFFSFFSHLKCQYNFSQKKDNMEYFLSILPLGSRCISFTCPLCIILVVCYPSCLQYHSYRSLILLNLFRAPVKKKFLARANDNVFSTYVLHKASQSAFIR